MGRAGAGGSGIEHTCTFHGKSLLAAPPFRPKLIWHSVVHLQPSCRNPPTIQGNLPWWLCPFVQLEEQEHLAHLESRCEAQQKDSCQGITCCEGKGQTVPGKASSSFPLLPCGSWILEAENWSNKETELLKRS